MEDSGIGSVLIYIIIAAVTIISAVVSGRNKKRMEQNKPVSQPVEFPDLNEIPKDFFPKNENTSSETVSNEIKSEDTTTTEDFNKYDEISGSHKLITMPPKKILLEEDTIAESAEKFDAVKAVIYSEILNKKY